MPRTLQCLCFLVLVFLYAMFAFLIQLTMPGPSFASPFDTYGFGGRGMAMGGAVASIVEDYTATYYNPAGFAFTEKPEIGGGFVYGETNLRLNGEQAVLPRGPVRSDSTGLAQIHLRRSSDVARAITRP